MLLVYPCNGQCGLDVWFRFKSRKSFIGCFYFPITLPLKMSSSSFLMELFDPNHWPIRFFRLASGKARHWPNFGFICLASHPPYFALLCLCGTQNTLSEIVILWQARAGFQSGYGGVKKSQTLVFLKFSVQISPLSLISNMWDYLILSLCLNKIILGKVIWSFLMWMKYFPFGGISFISTYFQTFGCLYSISSKWDF